MKKFNCSKIINTLNKNLNRKLPKKIEEELNEKEYKILVGDLCEDIKMVSEKMLEKTLKIGILNKNIEENLEEYNKQFDIVLTYKDADLSILNEILK